MLQTDLLIGAVGWDHDDWAGGFYPEDLPRDWRFGYYANRLRAVLVPASAWQEGSANPQEWLEDLYPEFRLVLEWELPINGDAVVAVREFMDRSRPVDDNVDAYLVAVSGPANEQALQAIAMLSARRPVCLLDRSGESDSVVTTMEGVSKCWLADSQERPLAGGRFLVTLSGNSNPRGIREIIEKINVWPNNLPEEQGAALFFTDDKAAETAFQARTIAELMGV